MSNEKLPNSAKELRLLYKVSRTTWAKWLEPLRDRVRPHAKIYTPKELNIIIDHLQAP